MDLKLIGLTKNEEKVLLALLKKGKSSSTEISKAAEVSYSKIYTILDSLEMKGLIKVVPEKTKKFIAKNPKIIKEKIREKIKELNKTEKELEKMEKIYEYKEKEIIEIERGEKNFFRILKKIPDAEKTQYSIKYNVDYTPRLKEHVKKLLRKKVDYKVLARKNKETEKNIKKWSKITEIKEIKNNGVAITTIDKKIMLINLIKANTSIIIKEKNFIELFDELFLNYYKNKN